ncbi:MAG: PKD domain-containing protein [Bacteroidetes bacterium]|nr:hypothetical protein [Bacteroidota bacterium]MBV6462258.1 hypothetical protein [Flavobacteriales bacterium]WKZ74842.1 MAG: hypothetical protein QY303_11930 [Vicingaceae bacterium]MCL4816064.1 hypothetical protein [Flavobacteriales bacterium]NOG95223.1 PKD domain-containing protein [Bacteroidota bacterium]
MKNSILLFVLLLSLTLASCTKKTPEPVKIPDNNSDFAFLSLTAAKEVLVVGEQTDITATANGSGLTYEWTAPIGILSGEGKTIQFTACCEGDHPVTCKVKDSKGNSSEKTINIFANP